MFYFISTVFTSAFLLFMVQPIIAKQILPWFGGSSAVWTTCMVFFQMVLLMGYGYSDWVVRRLDQRKQAILHTVLVLISLAWLPISLSLFNLADPSAIFVIFITSLWPTIINTALGVSSVPKDYLDVAQVLEMPRWRQITKIILPASLPYIFTGLRISLGIAWLVIVAVEMLTGGIGIGFFVWDEWSRLNLSSVFLAVFIIGLTGLILDYAVGKIQELVTHRPGG